MFANSTIALVRLRHSLSTNYFLFCSCYFSTLGCGFWVLPLRFALCLSLFLDLFFFVSAFVPSLSVVFSSIFFVFFVLLIFVCSLLSPLLLIPLFSFSFSFFLFFLVFVFGLFFLFSFSLFCVVFFLLIFLLEVLFPSGYLSVCLSSWLVLLLSRILHFCWFCFFNYRPTPAHATIPERACQDSSRQKLMNTEISL